MTNLINKLTKLAMIPILAGGLIFSGCGNNKKYQDFANFVKENGEFSAKEYTLNFSINDQKYRCTYYGSSFPSESLLSVMHFNGKSMEHFQDWNLDGLDNCSFSSDGRDYTEDDSFFQREENKQKYERLIENIPKLYGESKNKN